MIKYKPCPHCGSMCYYTREVNTIMRYFGGKMDGKVVTHNDCTPLNYVECIMCNARYQMGSIIEEIAENEDSC